MPAPHPRMHALTHLPGGPDPIPGLKITPPPPLNYEEAASRYGTAYWKLDEASGVFHDQNIGAHHLIVDTADPARQVSVAAPEFAGQFPDENDEESAGVPSDVPIGAGFGGGVMDAGGGSPGSSVKASDHSLGNVGNEPTAFFAWVKIDPATDDAGLIYQTYAIAAVVDETYSGTPVQQTRWVIYLRPDMDAPPERVGLDFLLTAERRTGLSTVTTIGGVQVQSEGVFSVGFQYDGTNLQLYLGGGLVGSVPDAAPWWTPGGTRAGTFRMGAVNLSGDVSGSWANLQGQVSSAILTVGDYLTEAQFMELHTGKPHGTGLIVRKNGTVVGQQPAINLHQGTGVTLTVTDDPAHDEVDVTIAATGGGTVDITGKVDRDAVETATARLVAVKLAAGDTQPAFKIAGDGKLVWGAGGSTVADTNLARAGAGVLHTPGTLWVGANIALLADTSKIYFGSASDVSFERFAVGAVKANGSLWVSNNLEVDNNLYLKTTAGAVGGAQTRKLAIYEATTGLLVGYVPIYAT